MKSLQEFKHYVTESTLEVLANKQLYLPAFLALVLLSNVESLLALSGLTSDSASGLFISVAVALLAFVVLAQIVLIQKRKHGGEGELSFVVPTFLLYNIYYTMVFFAVLFFPIALLNIPFRTLNLNTHIAGQIAFYFLVALNLVAAFLVSVLFYMVPLIAVCDDEVTGKFFKASRTLVKKNFKLVAWLAFATMFLEFSFLSFSLIQDPTLKAGASFIYSIPEAFFTIVLTIASVKIFYLLRNQVN